MSQSTLKRSPEEIAEIERHKYFLSEKVGYDVGWDFAETDWDQHHGRQFHQSDELDHVAQGPFAFLTRWLRRKTTS